MDIPLDEQDVRLIQRATTGIEWLYNQSFKAVTELVDRDKEPTSALNGVFFLQALETTRDLMREISNDAVATRNTALSDDNVATLKIIRQELPEQLQYLEDKLRELGIKALDTKGWDAHEIEVIRHKPLGQITTVAGRMKEVFTMLDQKLSAASYIRQHAADDLTPGH